MSIRSVFRAKSLLLVVAIFSLVLSACASSSTGTKTGVGVSGKTISLGILTPLSGPVAAPIGVPLTKGIEVFFKSVNDNGGIDGYKVNLVEKDTAYNPQQEVVDYNQIHDQVLMLAESLGTPTTFAIKDLSSRDHMLISAATLSSALARQPYMVLLGTPYRLQVENAFEYVVNKLGKTAPKTGIIYQDDDYGVDGLTGYTESVDYYHMQDVAQAGIVSGQTDMSAAVLKMKAASADYVFLTTVPGDTANIMLTAAALGYTPQWILQGPAFSTLLLGVPALVPILTQHAWVIGQGAAWGDTSKPGMVQLLKDVAKYAPDQKPDGFFEAGYTGAHVTYAILKKAADSGDLTRDGVFKAFNSLGTVDFGGLLPPATYGSSPNQRVPTRDSIIYAIDPTAASTGFVKDLSGDFTGQAAQKSNF